MVRMLMVHICDKCGKVSGDNFGWFKHDGYEFCSDCVNAIFDKEVESARLRGRVLDVDSAAAIVNDVAAAKKAFEEQGVIPKEEPKPKPVEEPVSEPVKKAEPKPRKKRNWTDEQREAARQRMLKINHLGHEAHMKNTELRKLEKEGAPMSERLRVLKKYNPEMFCDEPVGETDKFDPIHFDRGFGKAH